MTSLATLDQLAERIPGGIAAADEDRAQAVLDDVSALIRAEAEDDFATVPDVVVTVCLAAARRAWLNPDGRVSETIGGYSYRLSDAAAGGGIYLTDDEKRIVRRASTTNDAGVASVTLNRDGYVSGDDIYLPVEGSDKPIHATDWP